ncbi:MAG: GntR family transcriptional regulator [Mycobacteriales bacterium]
MKTASATVRRCLVAIRDMIVQGEVLPGQPLSQMTLAERLKVSRIPVREALTVLLGEGVVTYKENFGYAVARFDSEELTEIYRMRQLLETELLRSTSQLSEAEASALVSLNDQMAATGALGDIQTTVQLNREFHFSLFARSSYRLVRDQVERLWNLSEFYRALCVYDSHTRPRIIAEHDAIIKAARMGDAEALVAACDQHRAAAQEDLLRILGPLGRKVARESQVVGESG